MKVLAIDSSITLVLLMLMDHAKKLVRKVIPKSALRGVEQGFRHSRGLFWRARYGFPSRNMKVIAVTGTNGKTTTANYINEVLKSIGYKTAIFTTTNIEIAGKNEPNKTHYTLVKQSLVQGFFSKARKADVDWVVLEVTSHAIDQHRIQGVPIEMAVLTNLTQEHLDYHGTMEAYADVKAKLFDATYHPKICVLNADDEWFEYFKNRAVGQVLTYGQKNGSDIRFDHVAISIKGTKCDLAFQKKHYKLSTKLIGEFNLYNASAAVATGIGLFAEVDKVLEGVNNLKAVAGRMEQIDEGQDFGVIVDYSYAYDALTQALKTLKQITSGRVIVVFGATGDRDKGKRPLMGKAAAKHADVIFLTDDETYTEDPEAIRQAVLGGIREAGGAKKTTIIADREAAIKAAFKEARKGDVVLLAGMGHEDYRNMGGKAVLWDERQVARKLLKKLS